MRIVFVVPPLNRSGGIFVIRQHAQFLAGQGHEVRVLVSGLEKKRSRLRRRLAFKHVRDWQPEWQGVQLSVMPGVDGSDSISGADIVIATWWQTAEVVMERFGEGATRYYFVQDYGAPGQPLAGLVESWKLPLKKIVISRFLRDLVRASVSSCEEVPICPNGIEPVSVQGDRERNQTPVLGFLIHPSPQKGQSVAIAVIDELRLRGLEFKVVSFGRLARRQRAMLPFWLEHRNDISVQERDRIIASCDVWLFPSIREGYGLPILEAACRGTPVVATSAGAAPELSEAGACRDCGFDIRRMADECELLFTCDPVIWGERSRSARDSVQELTWDSASRRFAEIIGA